MKHLTITAIMAVMCIMPASAQWTLKQCVEHAIQHNISLKQQRNVCRQRELDLSTARNARLPDLNANVSENLSFGRGLTSDNTYTNNTTNSTSLALSTSIPISSQSSINAFAGGLCEVRMEFAPKLFRISI